MRRPRDIRVSNAIIDGEIACLDEEGRPQFDALMYRRGVASFVAFDLLWLNGRDYRLRRPVPPGVRARPRGHRGEYTPARYGLLDGRSPWVKIRL